MRTAQAACNFFAVGQVGWSADWVWGLPLIVLTVLIHVSGLGLISHRVAHSNVGRMIGRSHPVVGFVVTVGATTLLATCLHGMESRHLGARLLLSRRATRLPDCDAVFAERHD